MAELSELQIASHQGGGSFLVHEHPVRCYPTISTAPRFSRRRQGLPLLGAVGQEEQI